MTINALIVGAGRIGAAVAGALLESGHVVTVVDPGRDRLDALAAELPGVRVVCGSGTDAVVLEGAGVRSADAFAAVTGIDAVNLLAATLARFEFEVPRTIARIVDPRNSWMYTPAMGVDVALDQAELMAHLVAEELSLGEMTTLLKLRRGQYELVEERVHASASVAGKAVRDLPWPPQCTLVAVLRDGEPVIVDGSTVLLPGDELLAVVHSGRAAELASLLEESSSSPEV
ncbi:MAG TPA: TrkA family potassium uptake protein [Acidimicrobiales bacterium]|nr:TrkA family potassium uptake protein [Acidimicrobiales bacterium]